MIILPSKCSEVLLRTDNNEPFTFNGRNYLKPIYDSESQYIVLLTSRQAEKSTLIGNLMLCRSIFGDSPASLYVASTGVQFKEFANRRIDRPLKNIPIFNKYVLDRLTSNSIKEKIHPDFSMYFRSIGYDTTAIRGLSVRDIYFDEVQSIPLKHIPPTIETAHSFLESRYIFAGTPLSTQNSLAQLWYGTNQNEWIIRCLECKKDNPPLGFEHLDVKKPFLFCIFCGKPMPANNGIWVPQNPSSTKSGYRICRLATPTASWRTKAKDGILDKLDVYPEHIFINEVLAIAHDRGSLPITAKEIYANCEDDEFVDPSSPIDWLAHSFQIIAIDWAWSNVDDSGSHTIISVGLKYNDRFKIIFAKHFTGPEFHDPDLVLKTIVNIARNTHVKLVISDTGVGHKENERLKTMLRPIPLYEICYVNSSHGGLTYNATKGYYETNRSRSLDLTINHLKTCKFQFPRKEIIGPFAQEIQNVYTETDPHSKTIQYLNPAGKPDDFLHLLNYSRLAQQHKDWYI